MERNATRNAPAAAKPIDELVKGVGIAIRRMGAQSVMNSHAIAERFGLHTTDLECLDLIYLRGKASAGELARATGLTSGAMTTLIDRLEAAGYVAREGDPADRRRTYVRIRAEAIQPIQAVYEPMQAKMFKLWSSFSARELRLITDFLSRSTDLSVACVEEIRRKAASARLKTPGRKHSVSRSQK